MRCDHDTGAMNDFIVYLDLFPYQSLLCALYCMRYDLTEGANNVYSTTESPSDVEMETRVTQTRWSICLAVVAVERGTAPCPGPM